jgi:hypothetical protein
MHPDPSSGPAADTMDFAAIRAHIARIPRVPLIAKPTPLTEAPNLARTVCGADAPRIFVKRDDLTSLALGGNKLRNLEFRLARTMSENPDTVIVGLDLQSNSARQTVGACNKLGLRTILVLEGTKPNTIQGNLLMDYLLGAEVHFALSRQEQRQMLDALAAKVRSKGLSRSHPGDARSARSRGRRAGLLLHVLERQGSGWPRPCAEAHGAPVRGPLRDRDERVPRALAYRGDRQ